MAKSIAESVAEIARTSGSLAIDLGPDPTPHDEPAPIFYRTTMTVRQALRQLALEERSSVQALLTEAINDLLIARGKDPIA